MHRAMPPTPPTTNAPWAQTLRAVRTLGVGRTAEVFLAQTTAPHTQNNAAPQTTDPVRLPTWVALKAMHPHLQDDPRTVQRFYAEAKLLRALPSHPNLVPFYNAGRWNERHTHCMGVVHGLTLREFLQHHRAALPLSVSIDILEQLLDVLVFIHELELPNEGAATLVHGDLSPHNVLIDRCGRLRLIDFGVAAVRRQNPTKTPQGTIPYVSPEQCAQQPIDARSDLFVLGVLWWEMLEGRCPYTRFNLPKAMWEITEQDVSPPAIVHAEASVRGQVQQLWQGLQHRDPAMRFDSARAARAALKDIGIRGDREQLQRCIEAYVPPFNAADLKE